MQVIDLKALSTLFNGKSILVLEQSKERSLNLVTITEDFAIKEKIATFNGTKGSLLGLFLDTYYISIDNKVYESKDTVEWREALRVKEGNRIWHMCQTSLGLFAQEYGESLTSIYRLEGNRKSTKVISNIEVDPNSRHFHNITYDKYRDVIYSTLGDGNIVRAIELKENKSTINWKKIFTGPWQFVPISILEKKVLFGFDSSIAKGGIGTYYPENGTWNFLFLRYLNEKLAQFYDIKYFNNLWIGILGTPKALVVSKDLRYWHLLNIGYIASDNAAEVNISRGQVAIANGSSLVIVENSDLLTPFKNRAVMFPYWSLFDQARGIGFRLKRYFK